MPQSDSIYVRTLTDSTGKMFWYQPGIKVVFKNNAPESTWIKVSWTIGSMNFSSATAYQNIVCHDRLGEHINIRAYLKDGLLFGDCGACGEQLKLKSSWDAKEQARFVGKKDYDKLSNAFLVLLFGLAGTALLLLAVFNKLKRLERKAIV